MTHTIESLMALADALAQDMYMQGVARVTALPTPAIEALRAALTEALAPTFQPDWADFENGRECGRLEAAQPNTQNYPEKDISAQPVQEPLTDEQIDELTGAAFDDHAWRGTTVMSRELARYIERAHKIGCAE